VDFIKVKTPWLVKKIFPAYFWNIASKEKVIYLTFDDGPTPEVTEKVLDILAQYEAKATFFCIGKNVAANPIIYQRIINEEHAVGNHTYNHLKGWKSGNATYINDIEKTQKILNSKLITHPDYYRDFKLFRPPYGKLKPSQGKALQKLGYKIIMWDVLTRDWDMEISKESVLNNIIKNVENGSIVVLHDSIKASKNMLYALPKALDYFSKKGYRFKKVEF
jgi:peptidoglycan/xylan/chitin deacetylase (PgdA/CDA1 family)